VFTIENEKYNGYYLNKFDQDDKDVDTRSFDDANNQNDTHWYIEPVFDEVELLWREIFAYDNRASSEPTDITWVTYTTGIKSSDQFSTTNAMTVSRFNSLNVYYIIIYSFRILSVQFGRMEECQVNLQNLSTMK